MADHKIDLTDENTTADALNDAAPVERQEYRTLVEMFKNGETIPAGKTVSLDAATAANAAAAGDIEPDPIGAKK